MKVWLNRDACTSNLSACLSCFGQLLLSGVPDRACLMDYEDDGTEDFTVYMYSDGAEHGPYLIPADQRELVAYEGWDKFVDFIPHFRKNEGSRQV